MVKMKVYNRKSESERKDCYKVAYAALSQNLSIQGTAEVQAATWDIHMENFSPSSSGSNGITHGASGNTTTISDLKFTFDAPGETKTFTFDIKNGGSINAILTAFTGATTGSSKLECEADGDSDTTLEQTICGTTGKNDGLVKYTVKYDNVDITEDGFDTVGLQDKKLAANGTKQVEITVSYDAGKTLTTENLPTKKVTVTLPDIVFTYGQDGE